MRIKGREPRPGYIRAAAIPLIAAFALNSCGGSGEGEEASCDRRTVPATKSALQQSAKNVGRYLLEDASTEKVGGRLVSEANSLGKDRWRVKFTRTAPDSTTFDIRASMRVDEKGAPDPSTTYFTYLEKVERSDRSNPDKPYRSILEIGNGAVTPIGRSGAYSWAGSLSRTNTTGGNLEFSPMHLYECDEMDPSEIHNIVKAAPQLARTAVAG